MLTLLSRGIATATFLLVLLSCRSKRSENEIAVYKALNEGLMKSALITNSETSRALKSLEEKLADPVTSAKASIWNPKALLANKYSAAMFDYIQYLKTSLLKRAGFTGKENGAFNEGSVGLVKELFQLEGKGEELYKKLAQYRMDLLSIDLQIKKEFANHLTVIPVTYDLSSTKKDFSKTYFNDVPVIAVLSMLSQLQNNVKICENKIVSFCDSQCSYDAFVYDIYEPLISQSSHSVNSGEEIEIKAGIGGFTSKITPEIIINGKKALISDYGFAIYKAQAPEKEGTYTIPISLSYIDQDGNKRSITREVKYRVIKK